MLNPCASSASIDYPEISVAQFGRSQNVMWNVLLAGSVRLADPFWKVLGIFFRNVLLEGSVRLGDPFWSVLWKLL